MQIIPAIDIIDGKCVRLTKGDYAQKKVYNDNPAEVAKVFEAAGITRLHLVDLDGAKAGAVKNIKVLEAITRQTILQTDFSGGIKTAQAVTDVFNAGAAYVAVGSIAVKNKELFVQWLLQYGAGKFIVGADVLEEKIKISGWLEDTGLDIYAFLAGMTAIGVPQFFCTDISKDGAMGGPAVDLYKKIISRFKGIKLIASGGVSTMDDVRQLKAAGCSGAIIGKAIYEQTISLEELVNMND
jgi:phosphoribosylformimino-5-aminoimidazole carboxamide ribotide isomerase